MFTKHTPKDSPYNFRKSHEISASKIKPFLSYAQKTTLGEGTKCSPPPGLDRVKIMEYPQTQTQKFNLNQEKVQFSATPFPSGGEGCCNPPSPSFWYDPLDKNV